MMIMMRSAVAAAAALALTLSLPAAAHAAGQSDAPERAAAVPQVLPIGVVVSALPLAVEDRTGYQRTSFRHWNADDIPADGCNTRQEVLLAEGGRVSGDRAGLHPDRGVWWSYYDEREVTPAGALDIDHMVPLAEAWQPRRRPRITPRSLPRPACVPR
ncbi:hypothetical protein [Streptomyces sp. DSM 40907]|uniref:hypothetical protein n=1 Tax=Streptomyces kutzneri TaxID=3051179 RepID=UPI0028D1EFBA|nr:hypothetical protein [Streptomyces sp. DSM 40907]